MKYLLSFFLFLLPLFVWGADGDTFKAQTSEGVEMTFKVISENNKTCQVGDGNNTAIDKSYSGAVTIPSQVNGYTVTSIYEHAFNDCNGLSGITIPNSVTSIGQNAFRYCYGLTSITIPNSVTSIDKFAFFGSYLTSITIPNSVTSIGNGAFSQCNYLMSITVESGNNNYDSREGCNAIIETSTNTLIAGCQNTIIPNSVTSIGNSAFYCCYKLTSITIPNSVTSIGAHAFNSCGRLSSVTIPASVKSIGYYAFEYCRNLTSITIPNSVTSIGNYAFSECSGLTKVRIEKANPIAIESNTFSNRANATLFVPKASKAAYQAADYWKEFKEIVEYETDENITFADANVKALCVKNWDTNGDGELSKGEAAAVTDLGNVFSYSRSITSFDEFQFFSGLTSINEVAFSSCTSLTSIIIPNSVTLIGEAAFIGSGLTSITIPNSVTSIGNSAFYNCKSLTSITIPNSVTTIDNSAFSGCSKLSSITIPNSVLSIGDNAFSGSGLRSITIGNSVTSIGRTAFMSCKSLTSITIPNSVTSIGNAAFMSCSSLTSVTIGNSVKSIGGQFFSDCTSLTSITIPNSVTSIDFEAFNNCTKLTKITISNSVTSIHESAFWGCTQRTSISVEDGNTVYDSRDNCNALIETSTNKLILGCKNTVIPNSVRSIGQYAFRDCRVLTSITIPNSVEIIGYGAFEGCSSLTSITIPSSVMYIRDRALDHSALTSIAVDSGNKQYDSRDNCNAIIMSSTNTLIEGCKNTIIPNSVTSIGAQAFRYCTGLTSITIPNSVTSIGEAAFFGCSSLTSITIPNSVSSIDRSVFYDCSSLAEVMVEMKTPVTITSSVFSNRSNATLYVPKGCKAAYQAADYWKEFKEIIEFPNTDVNQDGVSNVVDVVDIARYVVGNPAETFHEFLADLNSDDQVNIADAVALVNEIAGNTNFAKAFLTPKKTITADERLTLTENRDHSLSLSMENSSAYTAFQFDLLMNSDMDVMEMQLNNSRKNGHQLLFNKVGDGHYRVVALSTSNNCFNGNTGELLNIQLDGFNTEELTVSDIHFYTSRGGDKQFDDLTVQGGTTAIDLQPAEEKLGTDAVYDLQGRKQFTLKRGVNIVNGKKIMVK